MLALSPAQGTPVATAAPELELTRQALLGNPAARDVVLSRLEIVPRVLSVINARSGSPLTAHDLADLAQQVFLLAWSRLERFDGRAPLEAWVYGIARIEFLSTLRRERRIPASVDPAELPDPPEPVETLDFDPERLRALLARLDPTDARLIHLRHFEGLDFGPIARELGLTLVNVRSRYYRSLRRLRSLYGEDDGGGRS